MATGKPSQKEQRSARKSPLPRASTKSKKSPVRALESDEEEAGGGSLGAVVGAMMAKISQDAQDRHVQLSNSISLINS